MLSWLVKKKIKKKQAIFYTKIICVLLLRSREHLAEAIENIFCAPEMTNKLTWYISEQLLILSDKEKLFLSMLRANSSLTDTSMVLLALEDLPISYAVAEFGSELQFLKSLPGTSCCSRKHAGKKPPSECLCCKIMGCIYKQQANCGQTRNVSVSWDVI